MPRYRGVDIEQCPVGVKNENRHQFLQMRIPWSFAVTVS
jgi:hypothetical protein